jgi:hypothetical protein
MALAYVKKTFNVKIKSNWNTSIEVHVIHKHPIMFPKNRTLDNWDILQIGRNSFSNLRVSDKIKNRI